MYYVILPAQSILDKLLQMGTISCELDTVIFVSSDHELTHKVLNYLNDCKDCELVNCMIMCNCEHGVDIDPKMQIKLVHSRKDLPKKLPTDASAYPYNYIYPEGLVNTCGSLQRDQAYVKNFFPRDAKIVDDMRNLFGPTII